MPRTSLAYDHGRYAFLSGKPPEPPCDTMDESVDWLAGYEREAADMVHYREAISSCAR